MNSQNKYFYYFITVTIVIFSFCFYSSNFYPLLNSDDALNILMAHYYKLPHDLYCWGQDRGGTLIPLVSQIFIKIFHLSALTSVSLSNYILLLIGYLCFASLFKSCYSKILFGLIWFLPFQRFIDLLRFPIGVEYSLIALVIFLVTKLDDKIIFKSVKNHLLILSIIFISILSIWVSDLAMVTIGLLLLILFIYAFIERRNTFLNMTIISYLIIGLISCFVLITYAKSFAGLKTELDSVKITRL